MKEKHQEKLAAHQAVIQVMEQHRMLWQSIEAMKAKYDRFVKNLKKVKDHHQILQTDLVPLKEKKRESRQQLIRLIFPVISVMEVYASDTANNGLQKLAKRNMAQLEKMKPGALLKYALRVSGAAEKQLGIDPASRKKLPSHLLTEYGLTGDHVKQLKLGMVSYQTAVDSYRAAMLNQKQSRVKILEKIKENEWLLETKFDKMMHLFRDKEAAFYSAYIRSRVTPPKKTVPAAGKPKPTAIKPKPVAGKSKTAPVKAKTAPVKAKTTTGTTKSASGEANPE